MSEFERGIFDNFDASEPRQHDIKDSYLWEMYLQQNSSEEQRIENSNREGFLVVHPELAEGRIFGMDLLQQGTQIEIVRGKDEKITVASAQVEMVGFFREESSSEELMEDDAIVILSRCNSEGKEEFCSEYLQDIGVLPFDTRNGLKWHPSCYTRFPKNEQ